jgi:acyl-CoA hydrolase
MEEDIKVFEIKPVYTTRLVKSEDLNHHGTLFAGRTAEWFVESGFLAAASLVGPKNVVCLKIHGMYFTQPVFPGEILSFVAKVVYTGRSSLISYVEVRKGTGDPLVSGFVTYIHVNEETRPASHHIEVVPANDEDRRLQEEARNLRMPAGRTS